MTASVVVTVEVSTVYEQDFSGNANVDKFYRGYAVGDWVIFQHGRRGATGTFLAPTRYADHATAVAIVQNKMAVKIREGYERRQDGRFQYTTPVDANLTDATVRQQLNAERIAALGEQDPFDGAAQAVPDAAATPAAPAEDVLGIFSSRALAAITVAVTDPAKGAEELAILNAAWPMLQQEMGKARSYLDTLNNLVMGARA